MGDIVTLAEAQMDPQLATVNATYLSFLISAASHYLFKHPLFDITEVGTSSYDEDLKLACMRLIAGVKNIATVKNGALMKEWIGDYGYQQRDADFNNIMTASGNFIDLLYPYLRRKAPAVGVMKACTRE